MHREIHISTHTQWMFQREEQESCNLEERVQKISQLWDIGCTVSEFIPKEGTSSFIEYVTRIGATLGALERQCAHLQFQEHLSHQLFFME